jgi:hypothetical protein
MFVGHACVTTTKGKLLKSGEHMFEDEYAESIEAVRMLVKKQISPRPWIMDEKVWMNKITTGLAEYYRREETGVVDTVGTSYRRAPVGAMSLLVRLLLGLFRILDPRRAYEEEHAEGRQDFHQGYPSNSLAQAGHQRQHEHEGGRNRELGQTRGRYRDDGYKY